MLRTIRFFTLVLAATGAAEAQSRDALPPSLAPTPAAPGSTTQMGTTAACSGQVLWLMTIRGKLYTVSDYATAPVANLVYDSSILFCTDIAVHPRTGVIYGYSFGAQGSLDFWRFDPPTYAETLIANVTPPADQNALDFAADGTLYSRGAGSAVFTVDVATGAFTQVGTATSGTAGDLAIDLDGTMLASTSSQTIDMFDPGTGNSSSLGPHNLGSFLYGIEIDCDSTVFVCKSSGEFYNLDRGTLASTLVGNINIAGLEPIMGLAFEVPVDRFGTVYCGPAVANSTGSPAGIEVYGSNVASDDDLTLLARNMPIGQFSYFLGSLNQGFIANPGGSQGNLCLGSGIGRYTTFIGQANGAGIYTATVGTSNVPTNPPGPILAGQTWNFQAWYRDVNPGTTSNFTDGIEVPFL